MVMFPLDFQSRQEAEPIVSDFFQISKYKIKLEKYLNNLPEDVEHY